MTALEELMINEIYNCPECHCPTGDDWQYVDFTSRSVIKCPQCGNEIFMDDFINKKEKQSYDNY